MSEPYLGEIRMFGGNYAPDGWALCNGQLLSISEYDALFSLIGTTYGGDGVQNFALPDLCGRIPLHINSTYSLGMKGGSEEVTLTVDELPVHTHVPQASAAAGSAASPSDAVWAQTPTPAYSDTSGQTPVAMNANLIGVAGGGEPHNNMMPSLTVSFIIALYGIYPSPE